MTVKERMETLVQGKAKELCSAMQLRGWASTHFVPTEPYGVTLVSSTGCRAWFGRKWGMICDDKPDHLKIVLDIPKGRITAEEIADCVGLPLSSVNEQTSSVKFFDNRDRDTAVIYLYTEELKVIQFKNSEILDFISDIRRWSCL